ncbi:hypothetical protein VIGAN_05103500 [Vigna angularis var. angularis]|uniref:Uncharacterized protein n=1 Tax=Vigna angularis var. angularis TaxID=157739 RepID=A0A0S3S4C8_PHAAN|nr:hypothetical protein VIGAN_05103500 [Vigna angularis var. angularis]
MCCWALTSACVCQVESDTSESLNTNSANFPFSSQPPSLHNTTPVQGHLSHFLYDALAMFYIYPQKDNNRSEFSMPNQKLQSLYSKQYTYSSS